MKNLLITTLLFKPARQWALGAGASGCRFRSRFSGTETCLPQAVPLISLLSSNFLRGCSPSDMDTQGCVRMFSAPREPEEVPYCHCEPVISAPEPREASPRRQERSRCLSMQLGKRNQWSPILTSYPLCSKSLCSLQ